MIDCYLRRSASDDIPNVLAGLYAAGYTPLSSYYSFLHVNMQWWQLCAVESHGATPTKSTWQDLGKNSSKILAQSWIRFLKDTCMKMKQESCKVFHYSGKLGSEKIFTRSIHCSCKYLVFFLPRIGLIVQTYGIMAAITQPSFMQLQYL